MSRSSSSPLFTVSQWAEMEHQAMVFKYLMAGLPVPPDLLAPLRFSLSSLTYASFCGKKIDTEPGRCRRTDGKKWRCSKDAHPDSKYCERHMNRGRYRSRKLVESQQTAASAKSLSSTTVASALEMRSRGGNVAFQNVSLNLGGNGGSLCFGNRAPDGAEEHNFMLDTLGSAKSVGLESTVNNPWRFMTSEVSSNSSSAPRNGCLLLNNNSQLQALQDSEALMKQQQQQYVGGEFGTLRSVKQEYNSLRPFFDEGPKSRDLGFHHNDPRSTNTSSETTQLSMSNLMAPSNFFKDR